MDLCCGMTMVSKLQSVYTEDGVLIHDVAILYCPTCQSSHIVPEIEMDYTLFAHNCETDGIKSASLSDVLGEEKLMAVLERYPEDERVSGIRVTKDQIDGYLDLLILARSIEDSQWCAEINEQLESLLQYMQKGILQ